MKVSEGVDSSFSVALSTSLSGESIDIPKEFIVTAELHFKEGYHPDYKVMEENLLRPQGMGFSVPFRYLKSEIVTLPVQSTVDRIETVEYHLEPLLPGHFTLTFLNVKFANDTTQEVVEVLSPIFSLDIVLPEKQSFKELTPQAKLLQVLNREPIDLQASTYHSIMQDQSEQNMRLFESRHFPWHVPFILFLFFCATLWIYKVVKDKSKALEPLKGITYLDKAKLELVQLEKEGVLDISKVKTLVQQLTNAVRYHFEKVFNIDAVSQTSEELIEEVRGHPKLTDEVALSLEDFLSKLDLIKFAGYKPTYQECLEAYEAAQALIQDA